MAASRAGAISAARSFCGREGPIPGGKRQVSSTAKASTVQYDLTFTPTTGIPTTPGSGAVRPKPKAEESVERRQVTVLFCDLVGSTALAGSRTSPKLPDC